MTKPSRIQRKRSKGWKKPEGTVNVTRPGKWGNPFDYHTHGRAEALRLYREHLTPELIEAARRELRGRDLMCYCPLDLPCHADILIEIANEATT